MRRRIWVSAVLIAVTCWTSVGFALVTFSFSPPDEPTRAAPWWPDGLVDVVNSDGRVLCATTMGFGWASDEFLYRGGAAAFNRFLRAYSEVDRAKLLLVVHAGESPYSLVYADKLDGPYDWALRISQPMTRHKGDGPLERARDFRLSLHVWPSARLPLRDIVVPLSIDVESGREIERFVQAHAKKRQHAAEDKEEPGA